ncbi:hypothetical protein EDL99_05115 [Ornithobacterium rhinotracheale]|nr:hypothetical protein [Ornithobacterium rhinotracheale]
MKKQVFKILFYSKLKFFFCESVKKTIKNICSLEKKINFAMLSNLNRVMSKNKTHIASAFVAPTSMIFRAVQVPCMSMEVMRMCFMSF